MFIKQLHFFFFSFFNVYLAIEETGGNIPDDLALVLSKELDRAARRAAKTIDAASAAVSVTNLFSESAEGLAGMMITNMVNGNKKGVKKKVVK